MRISDWSSDVCSSDLCTRQRVLSGGSGCLPQRMEGAYAEDIASGSRRRDRSTRLRHGSARPTRRRAALGGVRQRAGMPARRSEEHTSALQSLMRISYAVFCLKKKKENQPTKTAA